MYRLYVDCSTSTIFELLIIGIDVEAFGLDFELATEFLIELFDIFVINS